MIIQQHWFWQHGKNLGQDKIWVTQNTSSLCKTRLELTQLLQPMIQPSYAEFCLHPNYPSAPNTTVMCSQWQSQSCDMTKWPATVLISQLWFLTQSLADLYVAALLSFFWKPEKRKARWLSRNPAPGIHVRTRAGAPWSFRKPNQIGCPAHCHTAPCHPPRPEVMHLETSKFSLSTCQEPVERGPLRERHFTQDQCWRKGNTQSSNKNITHLPRERWISK